MKNIPYGSYSPVDYAAKLKEMSAEPFEQIFVDWLIELKDREQQTILKQKRDQRICLDCGGSVSGIFTPKCKKCGKKYPDWAKS